MNETTTNSNVTNISWSDNQLTLFEEDIPVGETELAESPVACKPIQIFFKSFGSTVGSALEKANLKAEKIAQSDIGVKHPDVNINIYEIQNPNSDDVAWCAEGTIRYYV